MKSTLNRTAVDAFASQPSHDEIADRAYELYMMRPSTIGSELDDWLRAEQELILERGLRRTPLARRSHRRTIEHDLAGK